MYNSQFCEGKYEKLSFKHQRKWRLIESIGDIRWMKQFFRNYQDFYSNLYCKAGPLLKSTFFVIFFAGKVIPESTRYVPLGFQTKGSSFALLMMTKCNTRLSLCACGIKFVQFNSSFKSSYKSKALTNPIFIYYSYCRDTTEIEGKKLATCLRSTAGLLLLLYFLTFRFTNPHSHDTVQAIHPQVSFWLGKFILPSPKWHIVGRFASAERQAHLTSCITISGSQLSFKANMIMNW